MTRNLALLWIVMMAGCAGAARTPFRQDPTVLELRHPADGETLIGNFAGRIPCELAGCDKIKILLSLFETADHTTRRYQLERVGEDGDARLTTRGIWTRDPSSGVIVLDDRTPTEFQRYIAVADRLLLLADRDDQPKVGTAAWSYTLSWIDLTALDARHSQSAGSIRPIVIRSPRSIR